MLFPRLLTQHTSEAMHVQGNDGQSNRSGKSLPTFRPNMVEATVFKIVDGRLHSGVLTAHCSKRFNLFAIPISLAEVALLGQDVVIKQFIKAGAVRRAVEAAIKTRSAEIRKQFLRDFDHRYGEVDVTAGPHNFVMQYELVRNFKNADRNTEFHRPTCLAFRDPPRVRLKDGEYLFVLWDCLALEKTPVDLVGLPHNLRVEVSDLIDILRWNPLCGQCRKECFNTVDMFSAEFKIRLNILSTGASDSPNFVEFIHEGFLQFLPLAPFPHIMF